MKYLLYASLLFIHFAVYSAPSEHSAYRADKATSTLLTDITRVNDRLVAVGKHGVIVFSDDGKTWQQASTPVDTLLTAVFFADEQHGFACGHDATILATSDAGKTWQIRQQLPQLDKPCLSIHFTNAQQGIAVGAYGLYFHTQDGGKTWQKRFLDSLLFAEDRTYLQELKADDPEGYEIETISILPHFNRIKQVHNALYIVGEMGLMAKSLDNGKTWQRLEEIYAGSFFDIQPLPNQHIMVAGLRGNVFVNNNAQWQALPHNQRATVNSIISTNNGVLLMANSGVIYQYNGALSSQQQADGKAIMNAVQYGSQLIMATEGGIKTKELNQ